MDCIRHNNTIVVHISHFLCVHINHANSDIMRTLRLSLDYILYEHIAQGKKKQVYAKLNKTERDRDDIIHKEDRWKVRYTPRVNDYDKVVFRRGTSNITMGFKISSIQVIEDNPEWIEIKLGEKL